MKASTLFLTLLFVAFAAIQISAQDTMWLELDEFGENRDIAEVIQGDTTASGERNNPDRIYGLRNGGYYFLSGRIRNIGYHLQIMGEERSDELTPPIIMMAVDENLESDDPMFEASGDISISNVYVIGSDENATDGGEIKNAIEIFTEGVTVNIDKCIFEYCARGVFSNQVPGASVYVTNTYVRNLTSIKEKTTTYRWFVQLKKVAADTVWMENNTFYNVAAGPFAISKVPFAGPDYFYFNHNTMINGAMMPFHFQFWRDAKITNNLFYNMQSCGDTWEQRGKQLSDLNHPFSIVAIDTIDIDSAGIEESRDIILSNNAWFVTDGILQMQADNDAVTSPVNFFTEREMAIFADKDTWPGISFDEETLYYENPGFTVATERDNEWVEYCAAFLEKPFEPHDIRFDADWHGDDVEPWVITWPIAEDFSYTNATLLTGSAAGQPIGDLNWFGIQVGVEEKGSSIPETFKLGQNYPNPFNPTTQIEFSIPMADKVSLDVYNVLGQRVAQLVNEKLNAGSYTYKFDASSLSSGVYIYKITTGNFVQSKKMALVK